VTDYIYNGPNFRAWIGVRIATSDSGVVNDVIYCKLAQQIKHNGVWEPYVWDLNGYDVYEYDHSTGAYYFIASTYTVSTATVQLAANTHGNCPASHGWAAISLSTAAFSARHRVPCGTVRPERLAAPLDRSP
jgi:hypothetical protein